MKKYSPLPVRSKLASMFQLYIFAHLIILNSLLIGQNTNYGTGALIYNTTGTHNAAFGFYSLNHNTTGKYNSGYGSFSLYLNLTGSYNTAHGYNALSGNTSGDYNTATGSFALNVNTTGYNNTATGYNTLNANTIGFENTATGYNSLQQNTTGSYNTADGVNALNSNYLGHYNTAIGHSSLLYNYAGNSNTAIGYQALLYTGGNNNTGIGSLALYSNTQGQSNTSIGTASLYNNYLGNYNTATGNLSLFKNTTGSYNTALGDSSGFLNETGSGNVFIGRRAGFSEIDSNKLYIGNNSDRTIIYGDIATGQVLLGNNQPNGYTFKGTRTLNVIGGIITDSIRVAPSNSWADYVFADNYNLRSLNDLSKFIQINKHLPNVPSASEVATSGINLTDMNIKLLEKVEELHLYLLQQQKEIEELKKLIQVDKKKRKLVLSSPILLNRSYLSCCLTSASGFSKRCFKHNKVYKEWSQRYLLDVNDETGKIVKLHESNEELKADMEAFMKLIERTETPHATF